MQLTQRITLPLESGLYIFEVVEDDLGFRCSMHFFPKLPKDEASIQETIEETYFNIYHLAITHMHCLYEKEKEKRFIGYYLQKPKENIVRVKDIYSTIELQKEE